MSTECSECGESTYMPGPEGDVCWYCSRKKLELQLHDASRELYDIAALLGHLENDHTQTAGTSKPCKLCQTETPSWFHGESWGYCVNCVHPCKCGRLVNLERSTATGGLCYYCEDVALERVQAVGGVEPHNMTVYLAIIQGWLNEHDDGSLLHQVTNDLVMLADRSHAKGTVEDDMERHRCQLKARILELAEIMNVEPPKMDFPGDPTPYKRVGRRPTWDDLDPDSDDSTKDDD